MTSTLTAPVPTRTWTTDPAGLLRLDAVLCAATGLLAAVAPAAVADALGPDVPTAAVRWVGVALVVWALDAAVLSRGSGRLVRRTTLLAGVANLAWEVATVALVAAGAFSLSGAVLALGVAAVVGGLGVLQLRSLRAPA
jgi:hypothetical protein